MTLNYYDDKDNLWLKIFAMSKITGQIRCAHILFFPGFQLQPDSDNNNCRLECRPCGTWKSSNVADALYDIAVAFSMPFVSLIKSDVSNIAALSSQLNSPWTLPVALVHIILFLLFFPFLLLPATKAFINVQIDDNANLITTKKIQLCKRRGTLSYENIWPAIKLSPDLALVQYCSKFIRIRKYSPDFHSTLNLFKGNDISSFISYLLRFLLLWVCNCHVGYFN